MQNADRRRLATVVVATCAIGGIQLFLSWPHLHRQISTDESFTYFAVNGALDDLPHHSQRHTNGRNDRRILHEFPAKAHGLPQIRHDHTAAAAATGQAKQRRCQLIILHECFYDMTHLSHAQVHRLPRRVRSRDAQRIAERLPGGCCRSPVSFCVEGIRSSCALRRANAEF